MQLSITSYPNKYTKYRYILCANSNSVEEILVCHHLLACVCGGTNSLSEDEEDSNWRWIRRTLKRMEDIIIWKELQYFSQAHPSFCFSSSVIAPRSFTRLHTIELASLSFASASCNLDSHFFLTMASSVAGGRLWRLRENVLAKHFMLQRAAAADIVPFSLN